MKNYMVKILWDFNIKTDHFFQYRKLDIIVLHKIKKKCHLIDNAVPEDGRQLQ